MKKIKKTPKSEGSSCIAQPKLFCVTLCSSCIISIFHFFHIALKSFHVQVFDVTLIPCWSFFILHYFHVAFPWSFSCSILLCFIFCVAFMLHDFHIALFHSFSFSVLHSFHVAPHLIGIFACCAFFDQPFFVCYTLFMLHFVPFAFSCCTLIDHINF